MSLVKRYHDEVIGGKAFTIPNGAARGMWTQYAQISQLTAFYDQVKGAGSARGGDIAIFGGGSYGHAVIVLADAAGSSTTLSVFEQNSPLGTAARKSPKKSKANLLGYLRPREGQEDPEDAGTASSDVAASGTRQVIAD